MREHTNAWGTMQVAKSATQEMQDCQEEQEEEVQEDRRCNKARIFARMLKARHLPADIAALYQDATEKLGKPARAFSHLAHQPPAPKELKRKIGSGYRQPRIPPLGKKSRQTGCTFMFSSCLKHTVSRGFR